MGHPRVIFESLVLFEETVTLQKMLNKLKTSEVSKTSEVWRVRFNIIWTTTFFWRDRVFWKNSVPPPPQNEASITTFYLDWHTTHIDSHLMGVWLERSYSALPNRTRSDAVEIESLNLLEMGATRLSQRVEASVSDSVSNGVTLEDFRTNTDLGLGLPIFVWKKGKDGRKGRKVTPSILPFFLSFPWWNRWEI